MEGEVTTRSLSGRIVLLCLADLEQDDVTPAHTGEVISETRDLLETTDIDAIDSLSEAAVNRALNRLEGDGVVEMNPPAETSPTGKGRPKYSLSIEASQIIQTLADDDEVAPIAEHVATD